MWVMGNLHRWRLRLGLAITGVLAALTGCARFGAIDDGSSVSWGLSSRGALRNPTRLPDQGEGYWTPPTWAQRGLRYGTDELVSALVHAARQVSQQKPGSVLSVADLSRPTGGSSAWHRSHQTGRDVDLLFYLRSDGGPVTVDEMRPLVVQGGRAVPRSSAPGQYLDVERTWLLIKALIDNPYAELQYVFVHRDIEQLLLAHASMAGEPAWRIAEAEALMHQPGDSLPHDDHMHVRFFCSRSDRGQGCVDRGALRWRKKGYKYDAQSRRQRLPAEMSGDLHVALLALGSLPFRGFVPQ
jgi:penicillin-insensitive murein endopeptidase